MRLPSCLLIWTVLLNPLALAAEAPETKSDGRAGEPFEVRGRVVDAANRPIAGADVESLHGQEQARAITGHDGRFVLTLPRKPRQAVLLRAMAPGGNELAFAGYLIHERFRSVMQLDAVLPDDIELVARAPKEIAVAVTDDRGEPVEGALVVLNVLWYLTIGEATTDGAGTAVLKMPADAPLSSIIAMKAGVGLDYILFQSADGSTNEAERLPRDHEQPLKLVLNGARQTTVKVVDERDRPMPGATVCPLMFEKPKKGGPFYSSGVPKLHVMTNDEGKATFEALPLDSPAVNFQVRAAGYDLPQQVVLDGDNPAAEITAKLVKVVPVRVQVAYDDGRPGGDANIRAIGDAFTSGHNFQRVVQADDEGRFELEVYPNQFYLISASLDHDHWSTTLESLPVLETPPQDEIRLVLARATRIFGRLTVGADRRPAAAQHLSIHRRADDAYRKLEGTDLVPSSDKHAPAQEAAIKLIYESSATTGEQGEFEFFIGPGKYDVRYDGKVAAELQSDGAAEREVPLHIEWTSHEDLAGRVVLADTPEQGVEAAHVEGRYLGWRGGRLEDVVTNAEGEFQFARRPLDMLVYARNEDGSLAAIVPVAADTRSIVVPLGAAASAHGRLVDATGKPLANARIIYGAVWKRGASTGQDFGGSIETDDQGEFTAAGLVPGWNYEIRRLRSRLTSVMPDAAGKVDLGDLKFGAAVAAVPKATGSIAGDIVPPEGAEVTLQGYQLLIYPVPGSEQPAAPQVQFQTIATVDEMGHFLFDGLPPGRYVIQPATTQNVPFFVNASAQLQLKEAERLEGIKLHLTVGRQLRGRVVDDQTGKAVESVEVSIYSTFQIDAVQKTSAKTDADGRYSAWFVPGDVRVRVTQVPVEYLLPSAETDRGPREFSGGEWPQIELARAAKLKVKVVDEQGKPVPRALLDIQRAAASRPTPRSPALEQTDARGEFTVEQLTPSEPVGLRARSASAVSESLIVVPSEIAGPVEVVVSEKLACWLSGQIVDRQGRPVPGTAISLTGTQRIEQENGLQTHRTAANEPVAVLADGTFETDALWPGDHYQLQVTAPRHGDIQTEMVLGEPGKRHDFGPLTLDAFATFAGQVVDVAGRPAPHAELRVVLPAGSPQSTGDPIGLVCDEEGRFELPEMNLSGTLRIWARAGRATTNGPVSFFPDLIEGPLKIVVSEAHAFRVAGEIVDRHGRPVRAASVVAVWPLERRDNPPIRRLRRGRAGWPPRSEAIEQVRLAGTTLSDDGSFVMAGLWPDQRYQLRITAEGYQPVESRTFSGRRGETANAGRFELRRTGLTLEGEVVDEAGQPVAGATVFNSGDAEQPLTATTDAAGRFRLEGLNEGPVYLLVRKPGFWPAGVHFSTSDVGAQLRLVDEHRQRPQSRLPATSRSTGAGDIAVARRLLSELWETRHRIVDSNNASRTSAAGLNRGLIFRMAAIDRDEALRWSAAEGGVSDDMLRQSEINRLVNEGVEGAIERAGADGTDSSLTSMAAGRLKKGDRDGAIRLLEMALQANLRMDATGNNAPRHIRSQAEIGALAIAASHEAWGIRWVNEAADRAEALAADADSHTRAAVAAALALFDLQRAVQLWEMPHPRRNNIDDEYAVALAGVLAPRDLRAARRVAPAGPLKRLDNGFVVESNTFIQLARRLARSQPETALELLGEIKEVDRLEKAETLGRIALSMAPRDKSRAFELIDQAFALCFPESRAEQNAIVEVRRAECGARIALMAEKAGYPDMKFVIAQVLALRLTPDEQPSAELRAESLINASRPLALLDRSAARTMLSEAARPPAPTARNARESKLGNWLEAWALVDAAQAEKLFHEVLAHEGPRISAECVESGLLPIIRLLGTPPEDREQTLFPTTSFWVSPPGDDD